MKRIIISTALSLVVGLGAMGQSFSPLPGAINKAKFTKGLQAVTVNVPAGTFINREAKGYIELIRDGKLIMQIPAQNSQRLYMYDGFTSHTKTGSTAMIAFYLDAKSIAGMEEGTYQITVPEGFFMLNGKTPNEPLSATYKVPYYTDEEKGIANGIKVPEIHSIQVTLPAGATNVKYEDNSYIQVNTGKDPNTGETDTTEIPVYSITLECGKYNVNEKVANVAINGNVVTLTFPGTYSSPGSYTVTFLPDAITYDLDGVKHTYTETLSYNVTGNLQGWTVAPANGSTVVGGFDPLGTYKVMRTVYDENSQATQVETDVPYYFTVDAPVPDGVTASAFTGGVKLFLRNADGSMSEKPVVTFNRLVADPANPKRFRVVKSILQMYDVSKLKLAPGEYVLQIAANALRYSNGNYSPAVDFNFTVEADPVEGHNYTVVPANDGEVKEITTITLTYPEGSKLTWANAGWASLSNGIADYAFTYHNSTSNNLIEYYQSITLDGNKVIFHLANPIREAGDWTLNVPVNSLLVNGQSSPSFDKWTVVPAPVIKLEDIMSLAVPAAQDFTLDQSYYGIMGMGIVQWDIKAEGIMINRACTGKVEMLYNGEKIAELDPANEEQVAAGGVGQAAEGDDTVIGISGLSLVFAASPDESAPFTREGTYTIVVPDGLLLNITTPVDGGKVVYNLKPGQAVDMEYVLSPADGETVKAPGLKEITLTFPKASTIEDAGTSAYLYFPNGDRVRGRSSMSVIEGNTIKWQFEDPKTGPIQWVNGQYKFVVCEDMIAVDMPNYDGETGNFPGLTAYINLEVTNVGVDGIDAEISYNVVGIDGTVLVENGTADALKALAPGLYIVNGKKVVINY